MHHINLDTELFNLSASPVSPSCRDWSSSRCSSLPAAPENPGAKLPCQFAADSLTQSAVLEINRLFTMALNPEINRHWSDCHVQRRNGLRDQKALRAQPNFPVFLYSPSSAQSGSSSAAFSLSLFFFLSFWPQVSVAITFTCHRNTLETECPWRGTQHHPFQMPCPVLLAKLELMGGRKKLPL